MDRALAAIQRVAAANLARRRIVRDELATLVADGMTLEGIAAHFGVTVAAVRAAKRRWGIRVYPKISDDELLVLINGLIPAPSVMDGYRQISARIRFQMELAVGEHRVRQAMAHCDPLQCQRRALWMHQRYGAHSLPPPHCVPALATSST